VQRELRGADWKYIENIVSPPKNDFQQSCRKHFWNYIKHQRTDYNGDTPIRSDGVLIPILWTRQQYSTNSTSQLSHQRILTPVMTKRFSMSGPFSTREDLLIKNGVMKLVKLLHTLNPAKAAGPDNIRPRVLKELANKLAPILTIIFNIAINTDDPQDWR
jgi:hypothetical protein